MGFLGKLVSATVKMAASPLAMIKDVIDVASGEEATNTSDLFESIGEDLENSIDSLTGENGEGLL